MNKEVTGTDISHLLSANATIQLNQIQKNLLLIVLSEEDWNHWITRGYVIKSLFLANQQKARRNALGVRRQRPQ